MSQLRNMEDEQQQHIQGLDKEAFRKSLRYSLYEAVSQEQLGRNSTALSNIGSELAGSMTAFANIDRDERFQHEYFRSEYIEAAQERLREFLSEIRGTFHTSSVRDQNNNKLFGLFGEAPADFSAKIGKMPAEIQERFKKAYGAVWAHQRAFDVVQNRKEPKYLEENFLSPTHSELENLAHRYCDADELVSPALEWALVDAMMYVKIVEFSELNHSVGKVKGLATHQLIYGPLMPASIRLSNADKQKTVIALIAENVGQIFLKAIFEIAALAITWVIASLITGGSSDSTIQWIAFTGATAARWIASAIRGTTAENSAEKRGEELILQLLWDMAAAHDHINGPSFNAGIVRHLLYRIEEKSVGLGSMLFNILDKREFRLGPCRPTLGATR